MSTAAPGGEARSMGASKREALRGLLNSLMPNGETSLPDDANVDKLAEKLDELLASKDGLDAYTNIPRDDQGRPLNEEGLPIMEITEPVVDTNESSATRSSPVDLTSSSIPVSSQAPLSPLPNWALSPAALAARRRERDRILDMLEQEEEAEFAREAVVTSVSTNRNTTAPPPKPATPPRTLDQAFRTSNPSSRPQAESLPISSSNEGSSRHSGDSSHQVSQDTPAVRKPKKQKSVSFVDPPSNGQDDRPHTPKPELDWGDVIPVPLDIRKPSPAKGLGVMKELVVERPVTQSNTASHRVVDSDDEDEDEDEELNETHDVPEDEESETEVPKEAFGRQEVSDEESDDQDAAQSLDIDDTGFDEAMLQREIALAYYARRNQIGTDISSGPLFDSTAMDRVASRDGDQYGSDGGVMETNSTRFRGSRLPGDPHTLINSAVQFGHLVEGELVVNEIADKEVEASIEALTGAGNVEKEDMTEKMIELLRRGDTHIGEGATTSEPKPSTKQAPVTGLGEAPTSIHRGSQPPMSETAPSGPTAERDTKPRRIPRSNPTIPPPGSVSRTPSSRPVVPPPPTSDQPMIIESGFGFDPAFQVAPPPKPAVVKAPAPLSETVKERATVPSPSPVGGPEKKTSRFAQARASSQLPASQKTARTSTPMGSDVVERTPNPPGVAKPPEPPKRVSRFRAERSGWM